jgi:hypothetical protein
VLGVFGGGGSFLEFPRAGKDSMATAIPSRTARAAALLCLDFDMFAGTNCPRLGLVETSLFPHAFIRDSSF